MRNAERLSLDRSLEIVLAAYEPRRGGLGIARGDKHEEGGVTGVDSGEQASGTAKGTGSNRLL